MGKYKDYPEIGEFTFTDFLTGKNKVGGMRHFTAEGIAEFIRNESGKKTIREEDTPFTITRNDGGRYIRYEGIDNIDVVIPNSLEIGHIISFEQVSTGRVTLVGDLYVVVNSYEGDSTNGAHDVIHIIKVADGVHTVYR